MYFTSGSSRAFESLMRGKTFAGTAKKYGINFALKKDATETQLRYLVFFKGRDIDVITAAFRAFTAKKLTQEQKTSVRQELSQTKEVMKKQPLREIVKNKDRGIEL